MILLQIQHENSFLPTSKHQQAKVHCFRGICMTALFIAQISFSEIDSKRDIILTLVATQWIAKDISSHGSQSKHTKSAIHWFGYILRDKDNYV